MFAYEQRRARTASPPERRAGVTPNLYSVPVLSRKPCPCGGGCPSCANARQAHSQTTAPENVHQVLRSSGDAMDARTRAKMERRLAYDFTGVRVHTDARAQESAQSVDALAYSAGSHIVFGPGRYDPSSREGDALLAHELAHVVQQGANERIPASLPIGEIHGPAEVEANRAAHGLRAHEISAKTPPMVARFTDTGHHVIEEAALAGAGFKHDQILRIEKGNVERDYSQVGSIGNAILLCKPHDFGGYKPEEHFDNFMWDAVTKGWRTRGASALNDRGVDIGKTPIDYISSELDSVASLGIDAKDLDRRGAPKDRGLEHLANAFHTVEDFFAHSNFVELMQGDTSHGATLMTGNLAGESPSIPRTLEAITPAGIREHYREESENIIAKAVPGSHTAMAHDEPNTNNYALARRLAALVIQDLGSEVLTVMKAPEPQRSQLMKEHVVSKVVRYLRPPDPQDKWWESLAAADKGEIDRRLDEAARRTPITVNQCVVSPLKNIEASQDSPMALFVGFAIPTVIHGNTVWFQLGGGVTRQMPFEPLPGVERDPRGEGLVGGAQITGRF